MLQLKNKAIVITGSGCGIGAACAKLAASLGARVIINDIDGSAIEKTVSEIRTEGGEAVGQLADISQWDQAEMLIEKCVSEWGRIDGLVNNAGLFRLAYLEEQKEADARAIMEVNVMGTLACATYAMKHMKKQGSGSIVNVTSGAHMGLPAMGVYGASKGAVASFTYAWAAENENSGIRVNALSPLAISKMTEERQRFFDRSFDVVEPDPKDNAPIVSYLLSDLSVGVNGQIIRSEGRQLALVAHPGVALPVLEDDWNVETIARAFENNLASRQFPTGIMGLKVEVAEAGSAIWAAEQQREDGNNSTEQN